MVTEKSRLLHSLSACCIALGACSISFSQPLKVGPAGNGMYLVPTKQLIHPAGQSVTFNGRPTDLTLSPDAGTLYIKDNRGLVVIDASTMKIRQEMAFPEGSGSAHGIAVTRDGSHVYLTNAQSLLLDAKVERDGTAGWARKISLPGPAGDESCSFGIALSPDDQTAYVCLSRNNSIGVVDLESGKLTKQISVGCAPYGVVVSGDGRTAYVSNWGGRHPKQNEKRGSSSGTEIEIDDRGICASGTVSVVDLKENREVAEIETGLHPSDVKLDHDNLTLYVANANADTVSVIDTGSRRVIETISVKPDALLPFGSTPNALALGKDGNSLLVANGGNNAVAVISLGSRGVRKSRAKGFIPTGWYPGGVVTDGRSLFVSNVNGFGSRYQLPKAKGWEIYSYLGSIDKVAIPNDVELQKYTSRVYADSRIPQILRAMERRRTAEKAVPVPERTGEPSVFEHVVYIVKENKTYDQVFGDLARGNNDPNLCIFGRQVTPNHHALAEQFVQLDNYYCNGITSSDGHCWVTEGNASDYMEKNLCGFRNPSPWGDDALAYNASGMIWDHVLAHGLSFRNYGEFDYAGTEPESSWEQVYSDWVNKTGKIKFSQSMPLDTLRHYSCREFPGWNLGIPDGIRADAFIREFREFEKKGEWPDFLVVYLCDDHTVGGLAKGWPTPRAEVADNDLALGRIVETISNSKFWPKTCIFVEEDDPQSGFDHVDGHRSLCLVVSPYSKRNALISQFYSQTSVLHTMERIMGIPPMNQMDAMAPVMTECFTGKPDYRPYQCIPNRIPLNEMAQNNAYFGTSGTGVDWERLSCPDRMNDAVMNRILWRLSKGDEPYPQQFEGAHGSGLAALHLKLAKTDDDD